LNIRELNTELSTLLGDIDQQIKAVEQEASVRGCTPYELRHVSGSFMLTDLLIAKANILTALLQMPPVLRMTGETE